MGANLNFFENKEQILLYHSTLSSPRPNLRQKISGYNTRCGIAYSELIFHRHTGSRIETIESEMSAPSIKPLNETNYEEWALAAIAYLQNSGYWGYVEGIELPPLKMFAPPTTGTDTQSNATGLPHQPESNHRTYFSQFYRYYERYQKYTSNLVKASGASRTLLDPALQRKNSDTAYTTDPKNLWEDIKKERERVFAIDGRQLRERLTSIRYVDFSSGMQYFTEIGHIAEQLKVCDDVVSDSMQAFHMMRRFPKTRRQ
jgi:hypothetical protein